MAANSTCTWLPATSNVSISQARFLKWPHTSLPSCFSSKSKVSISQARFLKWPHKPENAQTYTNKRFQSLRRDSSSGRIAYSLAVKLFSKGFNLSGEIPQVAAPCALALNAYKPTFQSLRRDSSSGRRIFELDGCKKAVVSISQARFLKWPPGPPIWSGTVMIWFQSLRRDSSSGRDRHPTRPLLLLKVSISQARFLKWPPAVRLLPTDGQIVSISQARFLKWPLVNSIEAEEEAIASFNLSGEIPQVAAPRDPGDFAPSNPKI